MLSRNEHRILTAIAKPGHHSNLSLSLSLGLPLPVVPGTIKAYQPGGLHAQGMVALVKGGLVPLYAITPKGLKALKEENVA